MREGGCGARRWRPDTILEDLYAESSIIRNTEYMSGAFLRDVIAIAFRPGATQEQRQAAIDMIGGRVIGGWRTPGTASTTCGSQATARGRR